MAKTYENFDITLETDGPVYHARVADDLTVTFRFPLETHEIEPFLAMFGKEPIRKMETPQLERATAIGGRLFEAMPRPAVRISSPKRCSKASHKSGGKGTIIALRRVVSASLSCSATFHRNTPMAPIRKVWVAWKRAMRSQKLATENFGSITQGIPSSSAR